MSSVALPSVAGSSEAGGSRILFLTHCAKLSGAEFVLCDLVHDFFTASEVFLFEDGPLRAYMQAAGLSPSLGHGLEALLELRREGAMPLNLAFARATSRAILQVARTARRHELIYANSQKAFVTAALAAPLARRPLIWHLHDIMTTEHFGTKQIRIAIGLANRSAKRVIVPSKAIAEAYCAAGGRREKLRIVPNGISVPAGTRSLDRASLRAELNLPQGFLISVVGRISPWKGQHVMLDALPLLPDAQCLIVGDALFGEREYKEQLYRLVDSLGLRARVRFLGHRTDVPRLMRASDVVVHTSTAPEPAPRVVVEAMLCGTPVAATRAGGVPEILTGELGALLYPPGDSVALAKLLRSFQHDAHWRTRLIQLGIEHAERCFSVGRMQKDINSVIREVLGARR